MERDEDGYFGEDVAAHYDETSAEMFAPEELGPTVDFLAARTMDGPALEFGIGTGRVALPLAARGIAVSGIDLSRAMVDRLRAKPGGASIPVVIGDFSTAVSEGLGTFSLVYLVYSTIENLTSQAEQVACFRNAAAHLRPGGRFVIAVGLPDLQRLPPGETVRPFTVRPDHLGFDEFDIANQGLISHHYQLIDGAWRTLSVPFRYVWPAELDLMAELAGMQPTKRWSGWRSEPFTSQSRTLVAAWQKPVSD